jgi:hypothetical protein
MLPFPVKGLGSKRVYELYRKERNANKQQKEIIK